MSNSDTYDLLRSSVTADDMQRVEGNGANSVAAVFFLPTIFSAAYHLPLPRELPPYWSINMGLGLYWSRDTVLRGTVMHEDFWADAVAIAASRAASQSWELKGVRTKRWQELLVDWGGDGYVPSQMRGVMDYTCTNNGEFWEVVRATRGRGSRVLGLVHLDSLRCVRTGDPQRPVVFMDLRGGYHALRDYQVITLCDMPDPSLASLGIGHCAAERSYHKVYDLAAMSLYFTEKITGSGANNFDIIQGMQTGQLEGILSTAEAGKQQKGLTYYQGNILAGVTTQGQLNHVRIPLRGMPDGFVRREEIEIAQLAYAKSLGLDPQELNPQLVGRGALGIGAQSVVLAEKSKGEGLAARDKQLVHLLNTQVLPASVTYAWNERDLRDEKTQAEISQVRAETRKVQLDGGEVSVQEARQLAVDSKDLPKEFLPKTGDATLSVAVGDEEQPEETVDGGVAPLVVDETNELAEPITGKPVVVQQPGTVAQVVKAEKELHGSSSAMIAFMLDESDTRAIRSALPSAMIAPDDEPCLHLTLVYLGKLVERAEQRTAIERALTSLRYERVITGVVNGVGKFNNDEGDGTSAVYATYDAPDLPAFREAVVKVLASEGVAIESTHGFTPHITLAYLDNEIPLPPIDLPAVKLTFSTVTLAWGDECREYPFVGTQPLPVPSITEANLQLAWEIMRSAMKEVNDG